MLTYPAECRCPRCQIHLRSQSTFDGIVFQPLCPVCMDDDRRILAAAG